MKEQIEKDKEHLKALSVKFYAKQKKHDELAKDLEKESKRLKAAKTLLALERHTQKTLRDELRKTNDGITKRVKYVKKTQHKLNKNAIKNNKEVHEAHKEARKEEKKTKAIQQKAIAESKASKAGDSTTAVVASAQKEAKKA